jgi:NAD(P)-dependent dehydrogenase (short-subunit alcohol dehydrogenase family)
VDHLRRFEGKVALVTGGGSGIGKASAVSLAKEGAKVIVADINSQTGKETVQMIRDMGRVSFFIKANISEKSDIEAMIRAAVETYGALHVAVNCAGITGGMSVQTHEYPEDRWNQVITTNLTGTWNCMKRELEQMLKDGEGSIVNVASAAGLKGHPMNVPYAASKHGIVGLTKTAAIEYATKGIRVNAVCPTAIETPMIMDGRLNLRHNTELREKFTNDQAMKRMGTPQEVADVVLWLCSNQSSFMTGHAIPVDGGAFA